MTRIPAPVAAIAAGLVIASGAAIGGVGWAPAAVAAPSREQAPESEKAAEARPQPKRSAKRGIRQKPPPQYARGMKLVEMGRFGEARAAFEQARRLTPNQPDVLNMLAYTQRKTGALDVAIENYKNALRQRPDFPQAREYLGEAYMQAAVRELTALKRAGPSGQDEYDALLRALHDVAGKLPPRPDSKENGW